MEKESNLVSVIVPVYNTENYLDKCIKSILNQTYKNIELILIDNNSTDSSIQICQKYLKYDSRIRIFTEKKSGVSNARNLGLEKAKGRYIFFVDSDDWINRDTLKILTDNIEDNVLIGIQKIDNKKYKTNMTILKNEDLIRKIFYGKIMGSVCLYLFNKDNIITKFDVNTNYLEDTLFLIECLKSVKYVKFINKKCYYYRLNDKSTTKKHGVDNVISNIEKVDNTLKKIDNTTEGKFKEIINKNENFIIIYELNKIEKKEEFKKICESRILNVITNMQDKNFLQKIYYNTLKDKKYWLFIIIKYYYKVKNKIKRTFIK